MNISAYPLTWPSGWPRTPANQRIWGQFEGTMDRVRRDLLQEIDRIVLGKESRQFTMKEHVIISTNMVLRADGFPSASAKAPVDPGVAVYFKRKDKPMCFACDKYDAVWKNMRAIQKTIEALRGIERWGSSQMLERAFTGFAALPERRANRTCWEVLGIEPTVSLEVIAEAYRSKAKTCHPDTGGSHESMAELNSAFATAKLAL